MRLTSPIWFDYFIFICLIGFLQYEITQANSQKAKDGDNGDKRPNIVIIMADDMGFDDVSYRGSNEFLTPNIDAFAYSGVILQNFYTASMCTPSRSALLTGKYPISTGMQHFVIRNQEPWGLPLSETTMSEIFQSNGYSTSLFGKWHLGLYRKAYTPLRRGFDRHFGYLGGFIDYFNHSLKESPFIPGHDFRDDLEITHKHGGHYATNVITDAAVDYIATYNETEKPFFMVLSHLAPHSGNTYAPVQAPEEEIAKFSYIKDEKRRTFAAMMSVLDRSLAQVVEVLAKKSVLDNTIILFFSDNGGPTVGEHSTTAANYPFRGQKNSPWEGGIRSSGAIWSKQLSHRHHTIWRERMYIADLLPTLLDAAGIKLRPEDELHLDGVNMWPPLIKKVDSETPNSGNREIVHNIDEIFDYVSYLKGPYKFINGTTLAGEHDGWLSERSTDTVDPRSATYEDVVKSTQVWQYLNDGGSDALDILTIRHATQVACNNTKVNDCNPLVAPCLFNLDLDPCEQNNLYEEFKETAWFLDMLKRIEMLRKSAHPPNNQPTDPKCDPTLHNYEWTWWQDESGLANRLPKCNFIFEILIFFIVVIVSKGFHSIPI